MLKITEKDLNFKPGNHNLFCLYLNQGTVTIPSLIMK